MNDSLTVLLLEDEPLISMDLESTLVSEGFVVRTIRSCAEAEVWLDGNRPDVAIVDIMLTDGPCHNVVARLSQAEIPFVVHSGDRPHAYAGTPFPSRKWLSKPAAPEDLVAAARAAATNVP